MAQATINILQLPVQTSVNGTEYMTVVSGLGNNAVTRRVQLGLISGFTAGTAPVPVGTIYAGPTIGTGAPPVFTTDPFIGDSLQVGGAAYNAPGANNVSIGSGLSVGSVAQPFINASKR